ncbi:Glycosyl transferase family 2 [Natronoarchaeum philippinense]|uniref:Glycosyl transferase family 2 n=1 Tax=Natronoarchaeum philippinense TaxID=558529 RepID=A0A285NZQ6_NATPI|nr:glycosyltransferase family A protein [Natronoarchaeum philippinense]SNZ13111.1 Glycosyl transferase family 2 [Natronoarchaeum philippinense]
MDLSVVVPTLNAREQLAGCLDALTEHAPDDEVIVVNGPSSDGTTGMVRERGDVDVLVELSDRNVNVSRNAGIEVATGDAVAFVHDELAVEPSWREAVAESLAGGASVVTGPTHRTLRAGMTTENETSNTVAGREVAFFNGGNVAFARPAIEALDGFDEYLETEGARDASHRLAALDYDVCWNDEMGVRGEYGTDGGRPQQEFGAKYRSLSYQLAKNYGLRPTVARSTVASAIRDSLSAAREVTRGDVTPTAWLGTGREVVSSIASGVAAGLRARRDDETCRRNPNGVSTRHDRAVRRYDWR